MYTCNVYSLSARSECVCVLGGGGGGGGGEASPLKPIQTLKVRF